MKEEIVVLKKASRVKGGRQHLAGLKGTMGGKDATGRLVQNFRGVIALCANGRGHVGGARLRVVGPCEAKVDKLHARVVLDGHFRWRRIRVCVRRG